VNAAFEPRSGDELAKVLRERSAARRAVRVVGGGSRSAIENWTPPADEPAASLSTRGLTGIAELDAAEGIVSVGAGTRLAELAAAADEAGWELPLDAPGAGATVGGVLAAGAPGPRWPAPRAAVLGMGVVLATGERTKTGGRVVKNVTGYDLAKLHVGSFGSFGVIESAWLRLRPRPERVEVLTAELADPESQAELSLTFARLAAVRVAALRGSTLVLELAGEDAVVEVDRVRCARELGAQTGAPGLIEELRDFAAEGRAQGATSTDLQLRASVLPSAVPDARRVLAALDAEVIAYPAQGLLYSKLPLPPEPPLPDEVEQLLAGARAAALSRLGFLRIEAGPEWVKRGRDVFGESPATLPLLRSIKEQFDPERVLNPGRFAGAL